MQYGTIFLPLGLHGKRKTNNLSNVMNYIIGSGPSGISCAYGLINKGEKVTILDVGIELEEKIKNRVDILKNKKEDLTEQDLRQIRRIEFDKKKMPVKLAFGSNFFSRGTETLFTDSKLKNIETIASFAKGGLSNVWGANISKYKKTDIENWPIKFNELEDCYEEISKFIPISAHEQENENGFFPIIKHKNQLPLPLSSQGSSIYKTLEKNRNFLEKNSIFFQKPILAVKGECKLCKNCLYGCPYNYIYNSSTTLEELLKKPNLTYINNIKVTSFSENADGVVIHAIDIKTGKKEIFQGKRLFIGAGAFSTAFLVLNSLKLFNKKIYLKDCQYYMTPFINMNKAFSNFKNEKLHTFTQILLGLSEGIDGQISHIELKGYNQILEDEIIKKFGFSKYLLYPIINSLVKRTVIGTGFLPSPLSPSMSIELTDENNPKLKVEKISNAKTQLAISENIKKLKVFSKYSNMLHLSSQTFLANTGRSYHLGGTFPMSNNPGELETDFLGRLNKLQRVHIIDSSIFPEIPSSSITFTVMANAFRIAKAV